MPMRIISEHTTICIKCGRLMQCDRAGIRVKELFMQNKAIYRVWVADLMGCPECGHQIVARFAEKPIAEHWQKEIMEGALKACESKTLGVDLFEWREYVPK